MALRADEILADAFSEISLRDPTFVTRQAVGVEPARTLVERYLATPLFAPLGAAGIERGLTSGLAYFEQRGVMRSEDSAAQSRLANLLADAAMDAAAAEAGLTDLRAPIRREEPLARVLDDEYESKTTAGGVSYRVRKRGEKWLLLVNAVGIPLTPWSRLLGDVGHDWKVLTVESAGCDLMLGGLKTQADMASDAERIAQVLDAEGVENVDVIGWCSGGRIAVQLAADHPERVRSLTLASASFRGALGSSARPTQFEEDIGGIFDAVIRAPDNAPFLANLLINSNKLAQPPLEDAALFRLPAQEHQAALVAPMTSGDDLKHYCQRIAADRALATGESLARVRAPILALAGSHDHVVSNTHSWETLNAHAPHVSSAVISGAGHYTYDLQYPYFLMALDAFTAGRPVQAARIGALDPPAE